MNEYYIPLSDHLLTLCRPYTASSQYLSIRVSWFIKRNQISLRPSRIPPITPMEYLPNKLKTMIMEQLLES